MTGSSKSKDLEDFPPLPRKHDDGRASPSPAPPTTHEDLLQQILEMRKQQGEIQRQQAEEHRLLREQLQRQAEIDVALQANVAAKSGTPDSEGVAKTAEQLLERRRKLAYVPEAPSILLAPALSYLHDVVGECNATLDASEDGELSYEELQKRFHEVTNSVHDVYTMLCNRWTMLELRGQLEQEPGSSQRGGADEAASAANANTRVVKEHRDQRWKERKKYDDAKDNKKPTGKGAFTGLCQSVYLAVPAARLYLRELYFALAEKRSWGAKEFNEDGKAHVLYDDGDEETLDLFEENFKIICSSGVLELTDETADVNGESIDCGGDYKENKRDGAVENFLTRSLCEQWRSELGQSRFTDLAMKMQQKARLDTTLNNYGPKARCFIHFCEQQRRPWLPATEATVLLYIASVLDDGDVKSASLQ
eukprot:gene34058-biopygen7905